MVGLKDVEVEVNEVGLKEVDVVGQKLVGPFA
jgi:hypothetical protein